MAKKKLAIIGECMIELSGQPFSPMMQNYGGDTINTAIYTSMLCNDTIDTHYVTSMGTDPLSEAIINKWQAHGVNTDFVLANADKQAGLYMIQNDANGERTFQYWRNDSAAKYLIKHEKFIGVLKSLNQFDAVYLSGISLAILSEEDCNLLLSYLAKLKANGVKFIYDSNYRPSLWTSKVHCETVNNKAYNLADLALVTFDDEALLWQDSSIEESRDRLHKLGVTTLVIKDGANGCQYSELNHNNEIIVFKYSTVAADKVVDTTAAGDSFNAGFLSQWLQGNSIEQSAQCGNALARQVIQQKGAIVPIDKALIESSMKG
ncbi:sugar kinase [Thalassotalea castellviae]|uniref:Sugar kinase n=1 Tax=Thalassotalea castellviae TaxID=3075612 RepID=A0ABU2ZYW2_9GAMM|nr:sugar kinase [Thalassotalea sp. W431]MDT0602522.1 sugar kinase [Thalassotalea sp. W431]